MIRTCVGARMICGASDWGSGTRGAGMSSRGRDCITPIGNLRWESGEGGVEEGASRPMVAERVTGPHVQIKGTEIKTLTLNKDIMVNVFIYMGVSSSKYVI